MSLKTIAITLLESYMISSKVKHFIFELPEDINFNYIPGQFITLLFDFKGKILRRSYSLANLKTKYPNIIEFAAGYVENGPGTDLLFNLKTGSSINMAGPFGRLILKDDMPARYVFVATSTGVTPYRCMIQELEKRLTSNKDLSIIIVLGVQKRTDLLYADEFIAFANSSPRVQFYTCFSQENKTGSEYEHLGYVQSAYTKFNLNPDEDIIYLCGNPSMIDESFNYLKDEGFTPQQIIREKYISGK